MTREVSQRISLLPIQETFGKGRTSSKTMQREICHDIANSPQSRIPGTLPVVVLPYNQHMSIGIMEILFHQSAPILSGPKPPPYLLDMTGGEANDSTLMVEFDSTLMVQFLTLMSLILWRIET